MSEAPPFANPEREWERAPHLATLDRAEVERRVGPTSAPLELLSGGQANTNVRIGADRVLRIYRRDPAARAKEQALLQRTWEWFRTPAVLDAGDDFLLIEYVPHGPLLATDVHGAAVGCALAEIHRTRFATSGFLGAELRVSAPFDDLGEAFRSYARSELQRTTWLDPWLQSAIDDRLAAAAAALRRDVDVPVLLHGDFKASNLHWTRDDRLLVLDWEFAYAGPALMDVGQLLRWHPERAFVDAFAESYQQHGGLLSAGWQETAEALDLVNLAGLLGGSAPETRRARDLLARINRSLGDPASRDKV